MLNLTDKTMQDLRRFVLYFLVAISFMLTFLKLYAFADTGMPEIDPNIDFLKLLIASIGGMKGMSTLAIIGVVVQLVVRFLSLPIMGSFFSGASSKVKLLIVSGLTMVGGPITLMTADGLSLGAALIHSTTLTAFSVFLNELYEHFWKKAEA